METSQNFNTFVSFPSPGVILSTLPPDHKFYLMSNISTLLAGMFMKKRNEACRQAAEKCDLMVERMKTEIDPNCEPF